MNSAPGPARGLYADGYENVARTFAAQLESEEVGASLCVYRHGEKVVDLWGGMADTGAGKAWKKDTRIALFSVTKGFSAMALHLLAERGQLEWDAPVAQYWPEFGANGKESISVATLTAHRGGLPYIDMPLTLAELSDDAHQGKVLGALERQRVAWVPGEDQGYHAITFGMYVKALFEKIAGEPLGPFLRRELFEPLDSDVYLGTPPTLDGKIAKLYPPHAPKRIAGMARAALFRPESAESGIARAVVAGVKAKGDSLQKRVFLNPAVGKLGVTAYNRTPARRAALAWASATGSAEGVARTYLPFVDGTHEGKRWFSDAAISALHPREGWSERDLVLCKPLGWNRGFLKEERHLFSPNLESFGHAGMGGALGWCDPVTGLAWGYVMNKMDWRVRARPCVALCRALYECEALH